MNFPTILAKKVLVLFIGKWKWSSVLCR